MGISKHDIHFIDRIIKPLGSSVFVLVLTFISVVLGVYLSHDYSDWSWFSRFGSLITVSGLLLVTSPVFDQGIYRAHAKAFGFAGLDENGHTRTTTENSRKTGSKVLVGITISVIGTLIWGFGDLIGYISIC